jgi:hypothetical protein
MVAISLSKVTSGDASTPREGHRAFNGRGPDPWEMDRAGGTLFAHARAERDPFCRARAFDCVSAIEREGGGDHSWRFEELYGGATPEPTRLVKTPHEKLRGVGLSVRKAEYLQGLAADVINGAVPIERLDEMEDAEVIAALTRVRGIGEWTAQMFLMFRLGRPDVLPTLDLAVQTAVKRLYKLKTHPTPQRVATIGAKWAPYRTVASWYLWRVVDDPPQ